MKSRFLLMLIFALGMPSTATMAEGAWTTKADMPTVRYVLFSGVVNGKVYAFGGDVGAGGAGNMVEEYDPMMDCWTRKANMPIALAAGASCTANGKIYVIGGGASRWASPSSSVQVYDAATDSWSTRANMPTARAWLSAGAVNGKIYAIGGAQAFNGQALSVMEEYDPAMDTWTRKANMPTERACLSVSVVDGKIYAIGGTAGGPWSQAVSTVEEYDPATDTWTTKRDMPTRRSYLSTSAVNGRIYAVGGFSADYAALSSMGQYDPTTDSWSVVADMPTARWGLSTNVVDGRIYAIGGRNAQGIIFSTVEEYNLSLISPDFNGNGTIDINDLLRLIKAWDQADPTVDIAPRPFGDGIVDAADLEVLMSYWGQEVQDLTLVAHWKFDETGGQFASDSAGGCDGTIIGMPAWRSAGGVVEGALELNGTTLVVADFVVNPSDGFFSVFAWIRGGAAGQAVIAQQAGADWLLLDPATGALMTELRSGGRLSRVLCSEAVIADGSWHRIGFTWDGSIRRLYVDDILVAEGEDVALAACNGGVNLGCGKLMTPTTFFTGLIDDVRIYNRVVKP